MPIRRFRAVLLAAAAAALQIAAVRAGRPYAGAVSDSGGHRLAGAQVLVVVPGAPPRYAFTSENGLFRVEPFDVRPGTKVLVAAYGFQVQMRDLPESLGQQALDEIVLAPVGAGPARTVRKATQKEPSGWGAGWSGWYHVCSDPLPPGEEIVAARFRLEGDRACGAWAECRESVRTADRSCWDFRLQGHSERAGGEAVGFSAGVLETDVRRRSGPGAAPDAGTIFLLATREVGEARAAAAAAELRRSGFRVPPPIVVREHVRSLVRAFRKDDLPDAARVAAIPAISAGGRTAVELEPGVPAPGRTLQVWLGMPARTAP